MDTNIICLTFTSNTEYIKNKSEDENKQIGTDNIVMASCACSSSDLCCVVCILLRNAIQCLSARLLFWNHMPRRLECC